MPFLQKLGLGLGGFGPVAVLVEVAVAFPPESPIGARAGDRRGLGTEEPHGPDRANREAGEAEGEGARRGEAPVSKEPRGGLGFQYTLTRDALGRTTRKVESIAGATTTFDYRYDEKGQLISADENGERVQAWQMAHDDSSDGP